MGDTVFINGRAGVHIKSAGKAMAFPDVCLCPPPPPGIPVPTPLPNTVMAADLQGGTPTVTIEGTPAGGQKSFFMKSTGNEVSIPVGGGVISHASIGKAYWGSFSMNVFFEGQPAVRHMDLLTHNHMAVMPGNTPPAPWISAMSPPPVPPTCVVKGLPEKHWISIRLVNENGRLCAGEFQFSAKLPGLGLEGDFPAGGGHLMAHQLDAGSGTLTLKPPPRTDKK